MHIDWFSFTAQIINFLVLVALLRWWLYAPIVNAMREREQKIARRVEEAEQEKEEAEQKSRAYDDKSRQIDQQREELLNQARHNAHEEQQRLLNETKHEIDLRRQQWQDALRREQDDFLADLRMQAGEMGLHIGRRTLAQLAGIELEQSMCDAFASQLEQLGDDQREEIVEHLNNGQSAISIRSAFEMSAKQRERFRKLVDATFQTEADVSFERSPDLICGLELDVGGFSFGWNVKDFLRDLELEFSERLKDKQ